MMSEKFTPLADTSCNTGCFEISLINKFMFHNKKIIVVCFLLSDAKWSNTLPELTSGI